MPGRPSSPRHETPEPEGGAVLVRRRDGRCSSLIVIFVADMFGLVFDLVVLARIDWGSS